MMVVGVNPFENVVEAEQCELVFPPRPHLSPVDHIYNIYSMPPSQHWVVLQECGQIIAAILVKDVEARCTLDDIKNHPWLSANS